MKNRSITAGSILFCGLFILCSTAHAGEWADSQEGMRKAFAAVKTIRTDFVQKKNMKILKQPLISRGRFFFRSPADIRWEYTSPIRSVLLMEGGEAKRYTWREGAYVQDKGIGLDAMRVVLQDMRGWLSGDFESSSYFKAETEHGTPVRIRLSPRDEIVASFIQQVVLTLSSRPGVLRSVEIVEGVDNTTLIEFDNTRINVSFPEGLFNNVR